MALLKKINCVYVLVYFIVIFLVLVSPGVCAADGTIVPVDEYNEAAGLILDGRYGEAEKIFDRFIEKHSDEPSGWLLKAAVLHYRSIDYEDFSFDEEYNELLDTAENLARRKIKTDANNLWARYFYYSAVSLKAVWAVTKGKFVTGIVKGRAGAHGMSGLISADEEFYDAYLMVGSYRFWKSVAMEPVLWLPFISDERERGISEVETAISRGKLSGTLLNIVLLEMLIEHDLEQAINLSEKMMNRYPSCRLFAWQLGEAYKRSDRFDDAVRVLTDVADSMANDPVDDGSGPLRCWWKLAVLSNSMGKKQECAFYCEKITRIGKKKSVYERQRKRIEGAQQMLEEIENE